MPRLKEPVDLIIAKGKTHLTKAEIEKRREEELKVPFKNIEVPECLEREEHREKFIQIASKLEDLGIMTELDIDCLAMYVQSFFIYQRYTKLIESVQDTSNDISLIKGFQNLQKNAFIQCQQCARELGLTITSRAKIVSPVKEEEDWEL